MHKEALSSRKKWSQKMLYVNQMSFKSVMIIMS